MSLDQIDEASVACDGADTLHGAPQTCPGDVQTVARGSTDLPVVVEGASSAFDYAALPSIADELRETAARVRQRRREFLVENGRDFLRWHGQLKGRFCRWVEGECGLTVRSAQLAMMVASYVDSHGGCENFSRLPAAVQYQLAAPSVSDEVRQQVLEACAEGRPMKVAEVKKLVKASKAAGKVSRNLMEEPPKEPDAARGAQRQQELPSGAGSQEGLPLKPRAHEIPKSKLDAATEDLAKQAIIKEIEVKFINNMGNIDRRNFVGLLHKLGKVQADRLAECFQ